MKPAIEGEVVPGVTMTADEVWTVYVQLWRRCEAAARSPGESTFVHYVEPEDVRAREGGYFDPLGGGRLHPEIAIARSGCGAGDRSAPSRERRDGSRLSRVELLAELCNLAHELGHSRSWRDGKRTREYEETRRAFEVGLPLGEEEQARILAEEERAWELARVELELLGFADWAPFEAARTCALDAYRQTFWSGRR